MPRRALPDRHARPAVLRGAAHLLAALMLASPVLADGLASADFADPTDRYDHAILGDALEWGALAMTTTRGRRLRIVLPDTRVFEDFKPRLVDIDGDGDAEAMVVETDLARGARLAIYDAEGLVAATPFIGQTHRWLAPVGAADLDGEGVVEIAYVDRPHLAKVLRIWRFDGGSLTQIASRAGLTNHRIGESAIEGGIALCGGVPTILTADADWRRVIATTWRDGELTSRDIGAYAGPASLGPAARC